MELMFRPLKHYADFEGRSRRTEYWLFMLFKLMVYFVLWGIVIAQVGLNSGIGSVRNTAGFPTGAVLSLLLVVLAWLVLFIPSLAVQVRRFHDQGMSGWLALLNIPYYIPYLGLLVRLAIVILMLLPGNNGPNQYGMDPKDLNDTDPRNHSLRNVFD
ncbi:MAG: hypothetical protein RL367_283 [Pseudomonadota bacterium]